MMPDKSRNDYNLDIQSSQSNEVPFSKIEGIIAKLQLRKKQMMEHSNSMNDNWVNTQQSKNVANVQRLHKYKQKVQVQNAEIQQLSSHLQSMQEQSFKATVELENKQMELQTLSQQIGQKFKAAFGLASSASNTNKKYLLLQLQSLECQIRMPSLQFRNVLCRFYLKENRLKKGGFLPPIDSVLEEIINLKQVNKLFGVLLQNQNFREGRGDRETNHQQNEDIGQDNSKEMQTESQRKIDDDEESFEIQLEEKDLDKKAKQPEHSKYSNISSQQIQALQSDHSTWLKILKVLKQLQKLQSSTSYESMIDVSNLRHETKQIVEIAKSLKKQCRQLRKQIKSLKARFEEIEQEISIKKQFVEGLQTKIKKVQSQTKQKSQENKRTNQQHRGENPERVNLAYQKQLKQIEKAIEYFKIKKDSLEVHASQSKKMKTACDLSTMMCSPVKGSERMLSPQFTSTQKKNLKKYSLKQLLSPSKNTYSIEKKKAWK